MNYMPDIAKSLHNAPSMTLDWVGMSDIRQIIRFRDGSRTRKANAVVQAYVNLEDHQAKGIHMSRLYLELDRFLMAEQLTPQKLEWLLKRFLSTHEGLSSSAFLQFDFDCILRRSSLKSGYSGLLSYPVRIKGRWQDNRMYLEMGVKLTYSSTCPCSAALARQLIQEQFDKDFDSSESVDHARIRAWLGTSQGIIATPHSQRSEADVLVNMRLPQQDFPILQLADYLENTLATPVQTAVKREDEQEFARLNGQNPMFCEDAARYLKQALDPDPRFIDYRIRIDHMESLHPHNAVAVAVKNVPGGYLAVP